MLEQFSGYKTYVFAGLFVLVKALEAAGLVQKLGISPEVVQLIEASLFAGGAAALRHGVQKAQDASDAAKV